MLRRALTTWICERGLRHMPNSMSLKDRNFVLKVTNKSEIFSCVGALVWPIACFDVKSW